MPDYQQDSVDQPSSPPTENPATKGGPSPAPGPVPLLRVCAEAADLAHLPYRRFRYEACRAYLLQVLVRLQWNQTKAADYLGLHRNSLNRLMTEMQIYPVKSSSRSGYPLRGKALAHHQASIQKRKELRIALPERSEASSSRKPPVNVSSTLLQRRAR